MVFKLLQIDAVTGVITVTTPDLPTNARYSYVDTQAIPGSSNVLFTVHSAPNNSYAQNAYSSYVSGFVISPTGEIVKILPFIEGVALCALSSTRFVLCSQNNTGYVYFAVLEGVATTWSTLINTGLSAPWIRKLIPLDGNHFLSITSTSSLTLATAAPQTTKLRAHKYVTPVVWLTNAATRASGVSFEIPLSYGDQNLLTPLDATNTKFMIVGHTASTTSPFKVTIAKLT
jgi:hypothetical protein